MEAKIEKSSTKTKALGLYVFVFVVVVCSLLSTPAGQPVRLRVVGYQNKSHIVTYKGNKEYTMSRESDPVNRPTVIQVPQYTYREDNQPDCVMGLKRDGNGKCRDIW
uniref:Uncharacterized protein n=1 Tax=Clastoptera arizonana TaxID=38151 RepID=A0A1B6C945_9HEMI